MIKLWKKMPNKERRFGAAPDYIGVVVETSYGRLLPGLVTTNQVESIVERAALNPEDAPKIAAWRQYWCRLRYWFREAFRDN